MTQMIRFGPAGNSQRFYDEGFKSTWQAPAWLRGMGLTAYECSFGRGVQLSSEGAAKIGAAAKENGVAISAHAPYFINLANPDTEKREASFRYIMETATAANLMGGERAVVHVGAQMKLERAEALALCREGIIEAYKRLDDAGLSHIHLCPETMGKMSQIGDLQETLDFCQLDERLIPCVDFAHLHALSQGGLARAEDFAAVLDACEKALGIERARALHVHFSTIEYTKAGEKKHHTFAEPEYGPRFEMLAPLLFERGYTPTIICESKNTMADDAAEMQRMYNALSAQ